MDDCRVTMPEKTLFPTHHAVDHEAMKTTYHLRLSGDDTQLLRSLACECIERIDELERKLSRYHDGGDVFRINHMQAGETLSISEEAHECLLQAMEASIHTAGLFNPTLGAMIEHSKNNQEGNPPAPIGQLSIDPERAVVTCIKPGRVIDLGGIGKGFTLDQLALYLKQWDIHGALLSAGASSHLALGKHSWPIDLSGVNDTLRIDLKNASISASGTTIQGSHIVSADMADDLSNHAPTRIWAHSSSAAFSDAWSTALMLMNEAKIDLAPSQDRHLTTVFVERDGVLHTISPN
ncbi:MAG: FAD:protein FMN transferase [Akkermansiaceae bacterium]|nr:FAD:protein FMN transferase [Akkermansiaceae bacterium]